MRKFRIGDGKMDNLVLVAVGAGVGIAVTAVLLLRRSRAQLDKYGVQAGVHEPLNVTRNAPRKREEHFYGVSVKPGVNCCEAVKEISRNRYLQGEAPSLPLPNCDRGDCRCIMQPEDDRRSSIDRRDDAFSAYGDFRQGWHPRRRHERKERRQR